MPRALHPMELRLDQIVAVNGERWRVYGMDGDVILLTRYCFASMVAGPQPRCMAALSGMMRLMRCNDGFRDEGGKTAERDPRTRSGERNGETVTKTNKILATIRLTVIAPALAIICIVFAAFYVPAGVLRELYRNIWRKGELDGAAE